MEPQRGHRSRLWVAAVFILALFAGLFGRLCWIQGKDARWYRAMAHRQHHAHVPLAVRRGSLLDRQGRELAVSVAVPSVFINPRQVEDKAGVARRLAKLLGVDGEELLGRMSARSEEVCLKAELTAKQQSTLSPSLLRRRFGGAVGVVGGGLFVRPSQVASPRRVAKDLADVLSCDEKELLLAIGGYRHFVWVKRKVSDAERKRVLGARGLPGVGVVQEYTRRYVHEGLASQLIGFTGIDENGLEGLELALNEALGGQPGEAAFRRDAAGRHISAIGLLRREPRPGADVELTLDAVVQAYAEAALKEAWELWAPRAAVAVVVEPRTGDLLAAASLPTFDANRYGTYEPADLKDRLRARYIVDWMEPGSIMKPFVLSGALTEGVVSEDTVIFCENGVWLLGSRRFHDHHAYGNLTAAEVIIKSSNIGAAKIGTRLGAERTYRTLRRYGFGQPTGLPVRGENPGLLRPPARWTSYSLPSISVGQELCVNMMQMTLAYAAIANDGVRMRPRVVRRVRRQDGTWQECPPKAACRAIPASVARRVRRILLRTVEEGTGRRAKLELYSVGGKTGTAQKAVQGAFSHSAVICSFVAMAPIERPRLVVMVSVDQPTKHTGGRHFGGTAAAPVVGRILNQSLAYLGVEPDKAATLARLGRTQAAQRATR